MTVVAGVQDFSLGYAYKMANEAYLILRMIVPHVGKIYSVKGCEINNIKILHKKKTSYTHENKTEQTKH